MDTGSFLMHPLSRRKWYAGDAADADSSHTVPLVSFSNQPRMGRSLGKPGRKKLIHATDVSALVVSLMCLVLALVTVMHEKVAWHLGTGSAQLVILGFLLSAMNLCLTTVTPTLFLLMEARFGPSTLQNYDAILRNQILNSQTSSLWRCVLGLMLALPLGLSAAYKTFQGGESAIRIDPSAYIANASYYGMFAPPGIQSIGLGAGPLLFANATTPFLSITSNTNGTEPAFPASAQTYGANILLLGNGSTAVLDLPQPRYVHLVQELLAVGESWIIKASIIGTVTTFDNMKTVDPAGYGALYNTTCEAALASSWAYDNTIGADGCSVTLLTNVARNNQTLQFVGLVPGGNGVSCNLDRVYENVALFSTNRQFCEGTWSITRGGIELTAGACNGSALPSVQQRVITASEHDFFLTAYYMPSLRDNLMQFATRRNRSAWYQSYMSTSIAAMLWSRITALESPENIVANDSLPLNRVQTTPLDTDNGMIHTYEQVGLLYNSQDQVKYVRPTLNRSMWLGVVIAIQPLLVVVVLSLNLCLYSVPIDRGFGLISILSGMQADSVNILSGAALSGRLSQRAKLTILPTQGPQQGMISYHIEEQASGVRRGVSENLIRSDITYH